MPECADIAIPVSILGDEASYELVHYEVLDDLLVLGSEFDRVDQLFVAYACGSGTLYLTLTVEGAVEDYGVAAYSVLLNTMVARGYIDHVEVELQALQPSIVQITPVEGDVYAEVRNGVVVVKGFGALIVAFYAEVVEEEPPEITPETPITETPTPTQPTPTQPTPTPGVEQPALEIPVLAIALGVVVVALVAPAMLLKRRR